MKTKLECIFEKPLKIIKCMNMWKIFLLRSFTNLRSVFSFFALI